MTRAGGPRPAPTTVPILDGAREITAEIRARGRTAVIAGGAVRDLVLGRPVTDVDIATDMSLEELAKLYSTHAVGRSLEYETVVVARGGHAYEITRLRGASSASPDTAGQAATDPLRRDTAHRDFTVNALLLGPDGCVIDHHGGLADLRAGLIRAVGEARERFAEDPARLLRAVRFAACLGFRIEPATAAALAADAPRLAGVAGERIGAEVLKMASSSGEALARGVELMEGFGMLEAVLPEVADLRGLEHRAGIHPEGGPFPHTLAALRASRSADPAVNLAVLLHDVGKRPAHTIEGGTPRYHGHERAGVGLAEAAARRLCVPQRLRAPLVFAVEHHAACKRLAEMRRSKRLALTGSEHWPVLRALALCDLAAQGDAAASARLEAVFAEAERDAGPVPGAPGCAQVISGTRIMELTGLAPGPRVGEILRRVGEWALDNRVEDGERIEAEAVRLAGASPVEPG